MKRLLKFPGVIFCVWIFSACASIPQPGSSLSDVEFAVFPYISHHDEQYFLKYQLKPTDQQNLQLLRVVYSRITNDKAYYFFSGAISHPEKGRMIERPLSEDKAGAFAARGAVYWLDNDGTETRLKVVEE
jgi:hypothetical protein